jgi:hypothetical protein
MPYIPEEGRDMVPPPHTTGELNYCLTMLFQSYMMRNGGLSYGLLNDCAGAAFLSILELYRRVGVPYEDNAIERNGDVFIPSLLSGEKLP